MAGVARQQSIRHHIAVHFRDAILKGELASGGALPSTRELARTFNTQPSNVQQAMSTLVKEGLLTRVHGSGTVVNKLERKLEKVAVYVIDSLRPSQFVGLLAACLGGELRRRGADCLTNPGRGRPAGRPAAAGEARPLARAVLLHGLQPPPEHHQRL